MRFIETRASRLLEEWLRTWTPTGKRAAVLHGPPGVGKTATIRFVAGRLGYRVLTVDLDWSYEDILRAARAADLLGRSLLHLDRPLEEHRLRGRQLAAIVRAARKPVVIETVDPRPYEWLLAAVIRVDPPPKTRVAEMICGDALVRPDYRLVRGDVRQALLLGYGSMGYTPEDWFRVLEECMRRGNCWSIDDSHIPVILDTLVSTCYGVECLEGMQLLAAASLSGRPHLALQGWRLPRPARPNLYYYRRLRARRELG